MDNRNHIFYYLILFLISPLLAVIASMANFKHKNARLTLILFIAAFGYNIILSPGNDGGRQAATFAEFYRYIDFNQFLNIIGEIISLNGGKHLGAGADELYFPFISYTLSRFTSNPAWLFMVAAAVYGFFYIRGISLVYSDMQRNWNIVLFVLFVYFISYVNLDGINSIRNFTGAWCFFNGAYLYLKTRNPVYIILVMIAPLIHVGYLVITLPFYAYLVIGDRKYVLLGILIFSFLFSTSLDIVEPYLMSTGLGEAKLDAYTGETWEGNGGGEDNRSFHARWYGFAGAQTLRLLFIFSLFSMGFLRDEEHDRLRTGLAGSAILMLSASNLAGFAPVLANRISANFALLALAYLVLHYSKYKPKKGIHNYVVYITLPAILLFLFTKYSITGDYMDFKTLISPLAYPFIGEDPVSIKEFIRELFL